MPAPDPVAAWCIRWIHPATRLCYTVSRVESTGATPARGDPYAGAIFDSAGNLYGTTFQGGAANAAVLYKLTLP
jgi:uncharacterized repeat protein (TIGR03803 family)